MFFLSYKIYDGENIVMIIFNPGKALYKFLFTRSNRQIGIIKTTSNIQKAFNRRFKTRVMVINFQMKLDLHRMFLLEAAFKTKD